jgi:GH35 family endo-1,4-beta-xylanase
VSVLRHSFVALLSFTLAISALADPLDGAEARIWQYRTSLLTLRVVDSFGEPVPGAKVRIKQTSQEFLFGAGALTLLKHKDAKEEARYQRLLSDAFNFATILSYWPEIEREEGKPDYSLLDRQARRLRELGLSVKAHPMILAGSAPEWAGNDVTTIKRANERRIHDLAIHFRGKIGYWDVVGDATTAHNARNGLGEWARQAGAADFTAEPIRWARSSDPSAHLIYNEWNLDDALLRLVDDLKKRKSPPDILGLEAHMTDRIWSFEEVWKQTEKFAVLGVPIHWSELTIPSARRTAAGWSVSARSEEEQADYVEQLYTLLFSHPAVSGITWWNPVDGDWDTLPGGLIRKDLTPKPVYQRLVSLIRGRWMTNAELTTDSHGEVEVRAFHGGYRIRSEANGSIRETRLEVKPGKTEKRTLVF